MTADERRASTDESDGGQRDRRRAPEKSEENRFARNLPDGDGTVAEREYEDYVRAERDFDSDEPDVLLDVPVVKVDEINFEVDELRARVALQAEVLDLLRLHVGADVFIGRVALEMNGVEAQALLKVRLDNVARVLDRVLSTIDRNPQLLERITESVGSAVDDVGGGAGKAAGELGEGAGSAVEEVGEGAGSAVEEVGEGAGSAVKDVGEGAGEAVEDTGETAKRTARGAGGAVGKAASGAGKKAKQTKRMAQNAREGGAARRPGRTPGSRDKKQSSKQSSARKPGSEGRSR